MPSSAPDSRLVASARSGDRQAFGRLVRRFQQPLARYLWALGVRDLEPRVEDVFVTAYHDLPNASEYPSVRAWLYTLATRLMLRAARPSVLDKCVLVLCGIEGFTHAEVAAMLGRSPAAVQAAFRRAKRRFEARMHGEVG